MAELVGQQIGPFDIVAYLGEGAHVHAYLAVREGREVVVKVLKSNLVNTPEFQARFDAEAKRALTLEHPNIVKMYDYVRADELLYIVEAFLPGGSLLDIFRQTPGPLPMPQTLRTLEEIAAGLDYAHARGVTHGDLKPENVLYSADGTAQLSDLGITKDRDQKAARSRDGLMFGNPGYMSPEEWQGREADARADIYALGILLFEMLTGQLPFELLATDSSGGGAGQVGNLAFMHLQHLVGEPTPLNSLRPDLPPAVAGVIRRAMAKAREQRYATAGQMVEAYKKALIGHPDVQPSAQESGPTARQTLKPVVALLLGIVLGFVLAELVDR